MSHSFSTIHKDLNRIVEKQPDETGLPAAKVPPAIRDKTGLERKQAGSFTTEEITVQSTDGLFTFKVLVIKA